MKTLALFGLALGALSALPATALTLDPRGSGQVLLYPYFTVNRQQQTLLAVTNLTAAGKVARVRFREAYDGREVLDFNILLAPHSTWSGAVFALSDAGLSGNGAALIDASNLCTTPTFNPANKLPDGRPYQPLLHFAYTDNNADTGPTDDARTREGFFEVIEMAELSGATLTDITPVNGVPPGCSKVASGDLPTSDLLPPRGGLAGSEAIVDVPLGTFYATAATALDGVYDRSVYTHPGDPAPTLGDASADANGQVHAYVPLGGTALTLNYPTQQAIDAISAVLAASEIAADYDTSAGVETDWVITFPTKHFYVDPALLGANPAIEPFNEVFGAHLAGRSDTLIGLDAFDASGKDLFGIGGITPPPPQPPPPVLPYESQVITFRAPATDPAPLSPALGAAHTASIVVGGSGEAHLYFGVLNSGISHRLRAAQDGTRLQGLPAIGFAAINYVNANVTPGVLANYSAALPLRGRAPCAAASGAPAASCP